MTNAKSQARLALRGIETRNDAAYQRMLPWTKLAFAIGGTQAAIATANADAATLWQMVPVAAAAVILPHHPVEYVYNHGLRFVTKTAPLPANKAPVRFAFFMATLILAAAALAFDSGNTWLGYALGGQVAIVSAIFVASSFCIPAAVWAVVTGNGHKVTCALSA